MSYLSSISNIKISLIIKNINLDLTQFKLKKFSNFCVLQDKFSYIIFKKSKTKLTHINITKIRCFCEIDESIKHFFDLFKIPFDYFHSMSIDNITITGKVNRKINLLDFIQKNSDLSISHNPEKFPGLFVKFKGKGTLILFSSGSYVIIGAKSKQFITNIQNTLKSKLENVL